MNQVSIATGSSSRRVCRPVCRGARLRDGAHSAVAGAVFLGIETAGNKAPRDRRLDPRRRLDPGDVSSDFRYPTEAPASSSWTCGIGSTAAISS
jgi:hypothetical protein